MGIGAVELCIQTTGLVVPAYKRKELWSRLSFLKYRADKLVLTPSPHFLFAQQIASSGFLYINVSSLCCVSFPVCSASSYFGGCHALSPSISTLSPLGQVAC